MEKKAAFEILNGINVNGHTEKKNGLTYLSWAWAWAEAKKKFPDAFYTIYENEKGWPYFTDGKTAWVKTGVTIDGLEHIEYLPIMDFKNKSIPVGQITSMEMNKAIQRSLTKAIARHGLGLYIYAGEDLPEASDGQNAPSEEEEKKTEEMGSETINATAWKSFFAECKGIGLHAYKVINRYGIEKPSEVTWAKLMEMRGDLKKLKNVAGLQYTEEDK